MPAEIALINQAIMDQGTPMTNDKKTNRMRGGKSPFDNLTVEYNATFPRTYKAKMDFFAEYLPKPEPTPQEVSHASLTQLAHSNSYPLKSFVLSLYRLPAVIQPPGNYVIVTIGGAIGSITPLSWRDYHRKEFKG